MRSLQLTLWTSLALVTLIWSSAGVLVVNGRNHHAQAHHHSKTSLHHHHHHHHRSNLPVVAPVMEDSTPAEVDLSSFNKDEDDDSDEETGGVQLLAEQESPVLEPAGSESKNYRLGLSIDQQAGDTDLDTSHGHASSDLTKGSIPNSLADTEMGISRHYITGGCPHGCGKHQICVVSAKGGRCVKKHPIKEGGSFMKHFRPKSTLELKSFAIDDSRHPKHHQMPVPQEELQLSSEHVDSRAEARIEKRMSAPSLEHHAERMALTEAQLYQEDDNDTDTDNFLSANKPGVDVKQRIMPSPTEGRQTNLANYFMSLRKEPVVHQKVLKKLPECHREQLEDIMKRLTGWFVLLHAKYKENKKNMADGPVYQIPNLSLHRAANKTKHHFSVKKELNSFYKSHKCHCVRSIIWEFKHLDLDSDKHIDHSELSKIEKNDMEPCVKPFIDSCDRNGDSKLTRHEWCCCFAAVRPPCFTHLRRLQSDAAMKSATFVPHCDRDGYYEKRQCHKGICWCVDLNGNEISGTRTRGTPHCDLHGSTTETLHLYIPKKHIMIRNAEVGLVPRTRHVGQVDKSRPTRRDGTPP